MCNIFLTYVTYDKLSFNISFINIFHFTNEYILMVFKNESSILCKKSQIFLFIF